MNEIGIVSSDFENMYKSLDNIECKKVNIKYSEDNVGSNCVVVICIKSEDEKFLAIDWLLTSYKKEPMYIIIYSCIDLKNEQITFFKLGANQLINDKEILSLVLINLFEIVNKVTDKSILVLNPNNRSLAINGFEKELTIKEYRVMQILFENRNTTVSYSKLIENIWPNKPNKHKSLLANLIFNLRKKIGNNDEIKIKTIRSKGYMLVTDE